MQLKKSGNTEIINNYKSPLQEVHFNNLMIIFNVHT